MEEVINATVTFESNFDSIQRIAELYTMTSLIAVGFAMNSAALVLWTRNKEVFSALKCLFCTLIAADQLYIASLFPFLLYRPRGDDFDFFDGSLRSRPAVNGSSILANATVDGSNATAVLEKYHFVHYVSAVLGTFQCFSAWAMCLCCSEAEVILRQAVSRRRDKSPCPSFSLLLFLLSALYFSVYLPEVRQAAEEFCRMLGWRAFVHDQTLIPFLNHWDFVLNEAGNDDLLYVVYFSTMYTVFVYVVPYVVVILSDKSIIDKLHEAQKVRRSASSTPASLRRPAAVSAFSAAAVSASSASSLSSARRSTSRVVRVEKSTKLGKKQPEEKRFVAASSRLVRDRYLHPCLVLSVTCNVFLVCVALKMIILTFKLFEYLHSYVTGARVFFRYLNVYSNFVQFLKAVVHLPALVVYDYNTRTAALKSLWRVVDSLAVRRRRRREKEKEKEEMEKKDGVDVSHV